MACTMRALNTEKAYALLSCKSSELLDSFPILFGLHVASIAALSITTEYIPHPNVL